MVRSIPASAAARLPAEETWLLAATLLVLTLAIMVKATNVTVNPTASDSGKI
ncbi:hypothetical protein [Synechococcus sp. PCC 7336]|uniref:hypothetical protein n=1 Tax=Synechococcus sp. PCC 7336 TaxID=195250 RepID=UPI0012EA916B|nr:hypothetical protein [Synechococcus sp. PCC 7336]